ncbi:MAG: hypothetical protein J6X11_09820 [Treponema sp.]|nr:hypothetical protein [Treponema sp.]
MDIECKELLCEPDNIEYIRDQIGAILAVETDNQYRLAVEAQDPNAKDYKIGVYIENDDPLQFADAEKNPFPLVNVSLSGTEIASGSTSINKHIMSATFLVDVYATGNTDGNADPGMRATKKAWKTARIARNILGAENYAYFKMRGVVSGRDIVKFEAGSPTNPQSAMRVKIVRITLNVDYTEGVAISEGQELELIRATISDENGRVLIKF